MLSNLNLTDKQIYEKYLEVLDEKRSNPELNVKVSTLEELKAINRQHNSKNDVFVTFTQINKFGNNPHSTYDTPLGIYAYPLKYVIKNEIVNLPFQSKAPFLQVFKAKNFIDIETKLEKYKDKIYAATDEVLGLAPGSTKEEEYRNENEPRYTKIWYTMYYMINMNSQTSKGLTSRKILLKAGITGIVDYGSGTIHSNEKTQAVFFDFRNLALIKTLLNDKSSIRAFHDDAMSLEIHKKVNTPKDALGVFEQEKDGMRKISNAARIYLESIIAKDGKISYYYALDILKGPFPRGEDAIAKEPMSAALYASKILKGPFLKGEDAIATHGLASYVYATEVLKGRFLKGEDAIIAQKSKSTLNKSSAELYLIKYLKNNQIGLPSK